MDRDLSVDFRSEDGYLYPAYSSRCITHIPSAVEGILKGDHQSIDSPLPGVDEYDFANIDNVICLLVDGFGSVYWQQLAKQFPFFSSLRESGTFSTITSIFPSETAAAITSINTGTTVAEHGQIGWNMYLDAYDISIQPLPFVTQTSETDLATIFEKIPDNFLFDEMTVFERLHQSGIQSMSFQEHSIIDSYYSRQILAGSERRGYLNPADLAYKLRLALNNAEEPTYFYTYLPELDKIAHLTGAGSSEYRTQVDMLSYALKNIFLQQVDETTAERTLLLFATDHGHINVEPGSDIDLLAYEEVTNSLRRYQSSDDIIRPAGSARNTHLFVQSDKITSLQGFLDRKLSAKVLTKGEVISSNLFGSNPSPRFERRCGDIVIIHQNRPTWFKKYHDPNCGYHGGLSPEEMLVPFGVARLSELQP